MLLLVVNFDALLGTDPTSPLRRILPALVLLAASSGPCGVRSCGPGAPGVYGGVGRTATAPEDEEAIALPTLPQHRY